MHALLLTALVSLVAAEGSPKTASAPSARVCPAPVKGTAPPPDSVDYLLFLPRLALWPLRAVVRLTTEPVVAVVNWVERSGLGRGVSRAVVFDGGTVLPVFRWESGRNPTAGLELELSEIGPHCKRCGLKAGAWAGGRWVWGAEVAAGILARKGLRFVAEFELQHRDDEWFNLLDSGAHRFFRRHMRAGGGIVIRPNKWLVARLAGAFKQVRFGLTESAYRGLTVLDDPGRPHRFDGRLDELKCGVAEAAVFLGRADLKALNGSTVRMRSMNGAGAAALARWYQGGGVDGVGSAELRLEAWWTFGLTWASDARLTVWSLVWYLHERSRTKLPVVERPRLGGFQWARGLRFGQVAGHALAFASLEYRMQLHRRVQGLLFLDYGGAGGPRFERFTWSMANLTPGGRLTLSLVNPWAVFVQAGVSGSARWQAAVGIGRY